jgi:hypothetical protein
MAKEMVVVVASVDRSHLNRPVQVFGGRRDIHILQGRRDGRCSAAQNLYRRQKIF